MWHSIINMRRSASNGISANVETGPDSPWFSGHFPGDPILPGIAQLAIVFEAIEQSVNRKLTVSGVSRVKFKQIIRPEDHLKLVVTPREKDAGSYSFRLMAGEELACKGIMTVDSIKQ
jgi:3-hydroxyacyl-[acyl-carrier-protein] dehydratase